MLGYPYGYANPIVWFFSVIGIQYCFDVCLQYQGVNIPW